MRTCRWATLVFLAIGVAAAPALAREFIVNGDFEEDHTLTWARGETGSGGVVERRTDLDGDEDYELRISVVEGDGIIRLVQRVEIPHTDLNISAQLAAATFGDGDAWSAAGLMVRYLDRHWGTLGETAIVSASRDCPWVSSPTFHLIQIVGHNWQEHAFNLTEELAYLPGVDPEQIMFLEIAITYTAENC
jgi:hypothetical protein